MKEITIYHDHYLSKIQVQMENHNLIEVEFQYNSTLQPPLINRIQPPFDFLHQKFTKLS